MSTHFIIDFGTLLKRLGAKLIVNAIMKEGMRCQKCKERSFTQYCS